MEADRQIESRAYRRTLGFEHSLSVRRYDLKLLEIATDSRKIVAPLSGPHDAFIRESTRIYDTYLRSYVELNLI